MTNHAVVIAGGGPTGLMLAAELALAGIDVAVVERRLTQEIPGTRAGGLHARTIEVLDQRGVAERFIAQGTKHPLGAFVTIPLDISDFPTRHNYMLALKQERFEEILAAWVAELRVTFYRGRELLSVVQDQTGVDIVVSDASGTSSLRARYVVGCDGGRSIVRRQVGIELAGWDPSVSYLIAEATMTAPTLGLRRGDKGVQGIGPLDASAASNAAAASGGMRVRVVLSESQVEQGDQPTTDELRAALVAIYGTDFAVRDVTWISRFTDAARQATSYRAGRVLIAGDAAHVHSPTGGQGLNLGVQDAVNLGWKLAQVVRGTSPESLLDTYQDERHPVGARVLQSTMAQTALNRGDAQTAAVRDTIAVLGTMSEPRKHFAGMMSGLDIRYELASGSTSNQSGGTSNPSSSTSNPSSSTSNSSTPGSAGSSSAGGNTGSSNTGGSNTGSTSNPSSASNPSSNTGSSNISVAVHPLVGRRMPDLEVETIAGRKRVFSFLHDARPLLLDFSGEPTIEIARWADRVRRVDARYSGAWELPVIGTVPAPAAVLIRPDGHVAWVGTRTDRGLDEALTRWFGPPLTEPQNRPNTGQ